MYLLQCGVGIVKLSDNNYSLVFEILNKMEIKNLLDLNTLNSAPNLSKSQIKDFWKSYKLTLIIQIGLQLSNGF